MNITNSTGILDTINSRRSINNFNSTKTITEAKINELIRYTTKAPTAFNVQNWHFVAVHTSEQKTKLKNLAYGQQKVEDAAVTFIVSGLLEPQNLIKHSLDSSLKDNVLSQEMVDGWINAVSNMYSDNPILQRDEAIRSASLAAMTMMLSAEAMGMVSCPLIGFDPNGVKEAFSLPELAVPAMLITVGFEADGNWPQKPRIDNTEVLTIV
ncbi:nitroreductase family protein [Vibrio superstes]|uniref:Nitroreductase n=1 Tax=Vibrio superstes NBRC 103154 TaxID=1219062 RepID=A0A511QNY2_9VIBR|nr:nitroreductase family protein [Vibrio superstes]GEM79020.1 nitroreductase [Vibrio superstes NBRC 103154]